MANVSSVNEQLFKQLSQAYADPQVQANRQLKQLLLRYRHQMLTTKDYVAVAYRLYRALIDYAALNPHRTPSIIQQLRLQLDTEIETFLNQKTGQTYL